MLSDPATETGSRRRSGRFATPPKAFGGRIRIDANLPYAEVKAAWESAAVGMVLTKTRSRSAARRWRRWRAEPRFSPRVSAASPKSAARAR